MKIMLKDAIECLSLARSHIVNYPDLSENKNQSYKII